MRILLKHWTVQEALVAESQSVSTDTTAGHPRGNVVAKSHIDSLTGVRALASLWVLSFHFRALILSAVPSLGFLVPLMNVGYLGVDLFFFLSGFILTYVHMKDFPEYLVGFKNAPRFLWLRLVRIWPAAAAMLMAWGAYNVIWMWILKDPSYQTRLDPLRLLRHLTLTQAWTPEHHDWNPVDWSISSEWLAYLTVLIAMPILAKATRVLSRKQLMFSALLFTLPVIFVGLGMQDGTDLLWHDDTLIPGLPILRVVAEFWAGALLCSVVKDRMAASVPSSRRIVSWPTLLLLGVLFVIYAFSRVNPFWNPRYGSPWLVEGRNMLGSNESVLILPLLLLLVGSLAVHNDWLTRLLSTRCFVLLGVISYSVYLCHWMFLDLLQHLMALGVVPPDGPLLAAAVVLAIGLSICAGWVLWRLVEDPVRKSLRGLFPRPRIADSNSSSIGTRS